MGCPAADRAAREVNDRCDRAGTIGRVVTDVDHQTEKVPYLSEAWLDRADEALADLAPIAEALAVGIEVTGGPRGDRAYRLLLGPDRVGVSSEPEPAGVRMSLAWTVAVAIAQGRSSAQRAFLDGQLRLGGDVALLLGHQDALGAIDDRLADLRQVTDFA